MSLQTSETFNIALCGNAVLRAAVRKNLVSFPAQVPAFAKPPSGQVQRGAVLLYFVRGWTVRQICLRYGLRKKMAQNLLSEWRMRAVSAGLIQEIQPEDLAELLADQQQAERDGHLGASPRPTAATSGGLMSAFLEDLMEVGVELSSDQLRRIERIVRDVSPLSGAPEPSHMATAAEVTL